MTIGVLALQGDFALHRKALDRIGVESVEVRMPRQLEEVAGLIMPGGESTTLLKLMDAWDFVPALEKFHAAGKPIFGTCAGLILLAREVESPAAVLAGLHRHHGRAQCLRPPEGVASRRRGRPISAQGPAPAQDGLHPGAPDPPPRARGHAAGRAPGGVRHGPPGDRSLVAAFHPELTDEPTVHRYFAGMVRAAG